MREDRIPQMASSDAIFKALSDKGYLKKRGLTLWALCPNERGLDRALEAGCKAIAVFTGASDTFTQKNIGMDVKASMKVFETVTRRALDHKIRVRAYVSVVWGCPYEGRVKANNVIKQTRKLIDMGIEQVSLGDTIGVATPREWSICCQTQAEITLTRSRATSRHARHRVLNCLAAVGFGVRTLDCRAGLAVQLRAGCVGQRRRRPVYMLGAWAFARA